MTDEEKVQTQAQDNRELRAGEFAELFAMLDCPTADECVEAGYAKLAARIGSAPPPPARTWRH